MLDRGADRAIWARARGEVTFGGLREEVHRQAELLRCHGISRDDTVVLYGTPSFTQIWVLLALWSLGAQVVLLEPGLGADERDARIEAARPRFLVELRGWSRAQKAFVDECEVFVRRRRAGRYAATGHCLVHFSSGATGQAKAVGRTPESLLAEVGRLRLLDGMPRTGERVTLLESVTHSFGLIGGLLHALAVAATVRFPLEQTPQAVAEAVRDAQVLIGNPWHYGWLAADGASARLKVAISGGDTLPREVADAFQARYGVRVGQAYGTTETGIVAADLRGHHGGSAIGRPAPGVPTRVRDGVLEVLVPDRPYLYEDGPIRGGWMSTHDLVGVDPATGVLRLRGRAAAGGIRPAVDLLAIEDVLRAHTQVTDAVVLGLDLIEAHVQGPVGLDQQELRSWCRRFLGETAAPARYHIVRELPRTARGKAVRDHSRLRQHA